MLKITLSPLDSKTAQTIAQMRGISVPELVSRLIHEEAAIELTHWRAVPKQTTDQPDPAREVSHDRTA